MVGVGVWGGGDAGDNPGYPLALSDVSAQAQLPPALPGRVLACLTTRPPNMGGSRQGTLCLGHYLHLHAVI